MTGIITVIHVGHYLHALAFLRADRFLRSPAIPSSYGGGGGVAFRRSHAMDDPRFLRPVEVSSHRRETGGDTNLDAVIKPIQAEVISMRSHCTQRPRAPDRESHSGAMQAHQRCTVTRCNGLAAISTVILRREVLTLLSGASRGCFSL